MTVVAVDLVRMVAPRGQGRTGFRPTQTVLEVCGVNGGRWQHVKTFSEAERQTAADLMKKIEAAGQINLAHWRAA
jgi:hypothetical protein